MAELVWSNGGMILTRESERTRKNTCLVATLSAAGVTVSGLEWNPRLRRYSPAITENGIDTTCMSRQETARRVDSVQYHLYISFCIGM
jgi:hypothetical protein